MSGTALRRSGRARAVAVPRSTEALVQDLFGAGRDVAATGTPGPEERRRPGTAGHFGNATAYLGERGRDLVVRQSLDELA